MRISLNRSRATAAVLIIGLLFIALTFVCPEGTHALFSAVNSSCAVMVHHSVSFIPANGQSVSLTWQTMAVVAVGLALLLASAPRRTLGLARVASQPVADPLHGRLRI